MELEEIDSDDEFEDATDDEEWSAAPAPSVPTGAPMLPALADRVESVIAAVASLSARVDTLAASTQTFHMGLSDRLVQHIESTAAAVSAQHEALDEYRRTTERMVTELRRATAATDKSLRVLIARLDEVATELQTATASTKGGGDNAELVDELTRIREELTQLKRRVGLRGKSAPATEGGGQTADPALLADAIAERLATLLEVVPDEPAPSVAPERPPKGARRARPARG